MTQRVKSIIYYDGQICNTDVGVIFAGARLMNLTFNRKIQLCELRRRIRRKVEG